MNKSAVAQLAERITGKVPPPRHSAGKGAMAGAALFFFCEFMSSINSNVPRIPVSWLMIAAAVMMESVLFFRIIQLLSQPRKPDLHFIFRLDYAMRTSVALEALKSGHRSFVPFIVAVLTVAFTGELTLLHERSIVLLVVIPVACILVLFFTEVLMSALITRHAVPCTKRDDIGEEGETHRNSLFKKQLAAASVRLAHMFADRFNGSLRSIVMRNTLYLLRGDILITLLITLASPVIAALLMVMIHNPLSPFVSLMPLVFIFMSNYHFATDLTEGSENLAACHWYHLSPRELLKGYFITLVLPALLPVLVFFVVTSGSLFSGAGAVRLVNFLLAAAVTILIACRQLVAPEKNDSDPALGLGLFTIIAVGNFIPVAGGLFSLLVVGIIFLLDGKRVLEDRNNSR